MSTHDASGRDDAPAFVEVAGLRKSFDGTMALQGVSFEVARGTRRVKRDVEIRPRPPAQQECSWRNASSRG